MPGEERDSISVERGGARCPFSSFLEPVHLARASFPLTNSRLWTPSIHEKLGASPVVFLQPGGFLPTRREPDRE